MSLAVVILAAGKGTRLNSEKYKVFHEIGNFPMLYHIINTAKQLNPKRIIIVISEGMKCLEEEIKKKKNTPNHSESVQINPTKFNFCHSNSEMIICISR